MFLIIIFSLELECLELTTLKLDYCRQQQKLRLFFNFIIKNMCFFLAGNVVQAVLVLGLAYTGCNSTGAILLLVCATAVHGGVSAGPLANVVDISPNFASKYFLCIRSNLVNLK